MKLIGIVFLSLLMMLNLSFVVHESQYNNKPTYGSSNQDIINYFIPFYENQVNSEIFTRSIFKLNIDTKGKVTNVEAVNHPFDKVIETKITNKISQMIWNPSENNLGIYLIIVENEKGEINISFR
jgi:hypothetical protein